MTYDRACELLGYTSPKSLAEKAEMAEFRLGRLAPNAPLRYKVACTVLIRAAQQA